VMLMSGMIRRSQELTNAALILLIVTAAATPAVYFSGDPAEEVVGNFPSVSRAAIEAHEDSAQISGVVTVVVGFLAAAAFGAIRGWWQGPPLALKATLLVALLAAGLMAWTSWLGGHVSHPELRGESIQQHTP